MRNFIHVSVTYRLNVSNNIPGTGRDRDSVSQGSDGGSTPSEQEACFLKHDEILK